MEIDNSEDFFDEILNIFKISKFILSNKKLFIDKFLKKNCNENCFLKLEIEDLNEKINSILLYLKDSKFYNDKYINERLTIYEDNCKTFKKIYPLLLQMQLNNFIKK